MDCTNLPFVSHAESVLVILAMMEWQLNKQEHIDDKHLQWQDNMVISRAGVACAGSDARNELSTPADCRKYKMWMEENKRRNE